jgi:hypothetical protein
VGTDTERSAKLILAAVYHANDRPIVNYGRIEWKSSTIAATFPTPGTPPDVSWQTLNFLTNGFEIKAKANEAATLRPTLVIESTGEYTQSLSGDVTNAGLLEASTDKVIELTGKYTDPNKGNLDVKKRTGKGEVKINGKVKVSLGTINIENGTVLVMLDSFEQPGGDVTNAGELEITGGYFFSGGTYTSAGFTTEPVKFIADSVTQSGGIFTFDVDPGSLDVDGIYLHTGGEALIRTSPYFTPNTIEFGELKVQAPNFILAGPTTAVDGIHVASGGELQLSGYATLNLNIHANITVYGLLDITHSTRVIGNLVNHGIVHLGLHEVTAGYDNVVVQGNYTQSSGGRLRMDIPSGTADLLEITGVATLAGTLECVAPWLPMWMNITLMSFGSRSGMFDTLIQPPGAPATMWATGTSMGINSNPY